MIIFSGRVIESVSESEKQQIIKNLNEVSFINSIISGFILRLNKKIKFTASDL